MASLELHDYDSGETILSVIPKFEKYEFIHVLMHEYNNPGEPVSMTTYAGTFHYDDAVLLRDYLTNVIDLYDKKESEKEITKKAIGSILNNKSSQ